MVEPKRNITIASVVCVLLILIVTIIGSTTACQPSEKKQGTTSIQTNATDIITEKIKLDNYEFDITPDDATNIAKRFLVSEYHYDFNKIVVNEVILDTAILPLRYWVDCEYGTDLYYIGVHVDTGQIDGVSIGSSAYSVDYTFSDDVVIE